MNKLNLTQAEEQPRVIFFFSFCLASSSTAHTYTQAVSCVFYLIIFDSHTRLKCICYTICAKNYLKKI